MTVRIWVMVISLGNYLVIQISYWGNDWAQIGFSAMTITHMALRTVRFCSIHLRPSVY